MYYNALYISLLMLSVLFFERCKPIEEINSYNSQGYTFILNNNDTLVFDKIYLDSNFEHSFSINKKSKTIYYRTNADSLTQLLNFKQVEDLYKDSITKIAFLIFQGDLIGIDSKSYIQRSLLEQPERIKDEVMAKIRCNGKQGDVLIFD